MNGRRKVRRGALVVAVLGVGVGVFVLLVKTKPVPARKPHEDLGTLVEVIEIKRETHAVRVPAQGTVQAAERVDLAPEVGGRILWRNPQLVPGGMVKKGDKLVRLDAEAYQLAMQQQAAQVDQARTELELERGRKTVAEQEWEILQKQKATKLNIDDPALALREPQLRSAKVAVEAAESAYKSARLSVQRTLLKAPFNAFVQSAMAEPGQLVNPQSSVATLVGTDAFWVQVSVPVENLAWLDIPGVRGTEGASARISQDVGAVHVVREGKVLRLLGDLDPVGRMARVLIEIKDPFNLQGEAPKGQLPLLLGAFVDVDIDAGAIEDAIELPRRAIREDERVFVYGAERKLEMRPVDVVWRNERTVLVKSGIEPGEKIIISRLSTPVEGMLLRLPEVDKDPEAKRADATSATASH